MNKLTLEMVMPYLPDVKVKYKNRIGYVKTVHFDTKCIDIFFGMKEIGEEMIVMNKFEKPCKVVVSDIVELVPISDCKLILRSIITKFPFSYNLTENEKKEIHSHFFKYEYPFEGLNRVHRWEDMTTAKIISRSIDKVKTINYLRSINIFLSDLPDEAYETEDNEN